MFEAIAVNRIKFSELYQISLVIIINQLIWFTAFIILLVVGYNVRYYAGFHKTNRHKICILWYNAIQSTYYYMQLLPTFFLDCDVIVTM